MLPLLNMNPEAPGFVGRAEGSRYRQLSLIVCIARSLVSMAHARETQDSSTAEET
jgi:hypothetical protein